jgi:hypothetical protein
LLCNINQNLTKGIMKKNKLIFEPLTKEDWENIYTYYHKHSIFHNPEQAIKDIEAVNEMLHKIVEEVKPKVD